MLVPPRWALLAFTVLVLVSWLTLGRGSALVSAALIGMSLTTGAYIIAVYVQVRRQRLALEKARILRRVADLEGQARPMGGPAPRS
jgi:hypothetical protein